MASGQDQTLYVEIVGSAGAAAGAGRKPSKPDETPPSHWKQMAGAVKGGLKTAGISFGMAAILKQSQLFTSYIGTIFQIVGALIDVTLAPLMPIFIPVLKFLAKMMPGARKVGEAVAGFIIRITDWFKESPIMNGIGEWWESVAPDWAKMNSDKLAQIAGGIFATIFLMKFSGMWKLLKVFWRIFVRADGELKIVGSLFKSLKGKIFKFLRCKRF